MHELRPMLGYHKKMLEPLGIPYFEVPQVPSDKLSPARQLLPGGKAP